MIDKLKELRNVYENLRISNGFEKFYDGYIDAIDDVIELYNKTPRSSQYVLIGKNVTFDRTLFAGSFEDCKEELFKILERTAFQWQVNQFVDSVHAFVKVANSLPILKKDKCPEIFYLGVSIFRIQKAEYTGDEINYFNDIVWTNY